MSMESRYEALVPLISEPSELTLLGEFDTREEAETATAGVDGAKIVDRALRNRVTSLAGARDRAYFGVKFQARTLGQIVPMVEGRAARMADEAIARIEAPTPVENAERSSGTWER